MRQACSTTFPLSQRSLLALLPSRIDPNNVVVTATGQHLSVVGTPQATVNANLKNGTWQSIELQAPRKWLLDTSNWKIVSFDPRSRQACVSYYSPYGLRQLSISV